MQSLSRAVASAQIDIHPRLQETVRRHLSCEWRQPIHVPSVRMFERLSVLLRDDERPLLLDSGCGTGDSTLQLAALNPGHCVIGIDQSAARLQRLAPLGIALHANAILLRAELTSFWRLFVAGGWRAERNYLLYPNPWPKAVYLNRRWHGHPVLPILLNTASAIELRSNWRVYADEFAFALTIAGHGEARAEPYDGEIPLTPFELKYRQSGHLLWRVAAPIARSQGTT